MGRGDGRRPLPYTIGHENAGWVHEIGSGVTNVAVGDTVILHPTPTCGLCRACRAGDDMHCINQHVPRPVAGRRDGRVPADLGAGLREARPRHPAPGRRRPRRRRHHRLPRGAQGDPAAVPGDHRRGDRGRRPRPHRHPVPGRADRDHASSSSTATRTRSSSPSSSARTRRWWPTATRSQAVQDLTDGDGRRSCSTSSPSRAPRTRASR